MKGEEDVVPAQKNIPFSAADGQCPNKALSAKIGV